MHYTYSEFCFKDSHKVILILSDCALERQQPYLQRGRGRGRPVAGPLPAAQARGDLSRGQTIPLSEQGLVVISPYSWAF